LTLQNGLGNEEFPADRFSVLGVCFVLRLSDAAQRSERSLRSWDAFDWSFRGLNRTRGFDRGVFSGKRHRREVGRGPGERALAQAGLKYSA
jgi:hypothetical protein